MVTKVRVAKRPAPDDRDPENRPTRPNRVAPSMVLFKERFEIPVAETLFK